MAQRGMTDVIELRDDALPHLKGNSPERKPEPLYQPTKRQNRFFCGRGRMFATKAGAVCSTCSTRFSREFRRDRQRTQERRGEAVQQLISRYDQMPRSSVRGSLGLGWRGWRCSRRRRARSVSSVEALAKLPPEEAGAR
jgi:hypothetical protein